MTKKKKDTTLLVKMNSEVKKQFIEVCDRDDTTASREIRKFIERYIKENS